MTTQTNDRQTSERERLAKWLDSVSLDHCARDLELAAGQLRADEAEIAQLRAERDEAFRMSRCECETNECCANLVKHSAELAALRAENGRLLGKRVAKDARLIDAIVERNRLRAENEALRTVTEEDVKSISARTGTMPVDVRLSIESFIRSKENRRG